MALAWWDVEDPVAYFGIKGERTDEQKERAARFRNEFGGGSRAGTLLNGYVSGEYSARNIYLYGTDLNAIQSAQEAGISAYEGGDFGEYLQSNWDTLSSFLGGTNVGPDGTLGSLDTTPLQATGDKTQFSQDDFAMSDYMQSMQAAAEQANVPLYVDSPDGARYELNIGQFGDVGLGEYKQVQEPYDAIDIAGQIFGEVIKAVLVAGVTGEIGSAISDVMSFAENVQTADEVRENVGVLQQIIDTYIENKDLVDDIMGTVEDVVGTSTESVVPEDVVIEEEPSYEDYLQQVREASLGLEPDADLMGTKDVFIQIEEDETPFFEPEQPERPEPEIPEVDSLPIEVTEPEVTFEQPAGGGGAGGGGGAATTTTTTTDEATTTETSAQPTGGSGDGEITTDVGAEDYAPYVPDTGTETIIGQLEEAIANEEDPDVKEDLVEVLEDYQEGTTETAPVETVEPPPEDVFEPGDTTETTTEEDSGEEGEDVYVTLDILLGGDDASDTLDNVITSTLEPEPEPTTVPPATTVDTDGDGIDNSADNDDDNDGIPDVTDPDDDNDGTSDLDEAIVDQGGVVTTGGGTGVGTTDGTADGGGADTGGAGDTGTGEGGAGEGTTGEGTGEEGTGEGEGGEGVGTGLGGVGMFSAYVPPRKTTPLELERYRPDLQPFRWQLEEPVRLFDYIDYNPLRNIR